jgi:hypothetical protein
MPLEGVKESFRLQDTPSVSFYLSLDSVKLHYPATNKKKRREYYSLTDIFVCYSLFFVPLFFLSRLVIQLLAISLSFI